MDSRRPRKSPSHRDGRQAARRARSCQRQSDLRSRCSEIARRGDDIIATPHFTSRARDARGLVRPGMIRSTIPIALAFLAAACGSAPLPPPKPVGPTFEQKMAWILRLEDQRVLRDPSPPAPPPVPATSPPAARKGRAAPIVAPPPPPPSDLVRMLGDDEARVRRRAALAVGRVGLSEGIDPLTSLLGDGDAEVRQMAALGLGLLGDVRARDALVRALADPSPLVQGSAAQALGLLGDAGAADPIGRLVSQIVQSGALAQPPGDDEDVRRDTPAGVFRL